HHYAHDVRGELVTQEVTEQGGSGVATLAKTVHMRDQIGRVYVTTRSIIPTYGGASARVTTHEYNKRSQVTKVDHPGGRSVHYVYDDRGRLDKIDDPQNPGQNKTECDYLAGTDFICEI